MKYKTISTKQELWAKHWATGQKIVSGWITATIEEAKAADASRVHLLRIFLNSPVPAGMENVLIRRVHVRPVKGSNPPKTVYGEFLVEAFPVRAEIRPRLES